MTPPPTAIETVSEKLRKERGLEWCVIYDTLRYHRLSNMTFEGTDEPFCLVDLVSTIGGDITTGEDELLALADDISLAIAALSRRSLDTADGVERPSYDAISAMVHACRERQKAAGEGDQMLSRWISEGLDGLFASRTRNTETVVKAEPVAYINAQGGVLLSEAGEEWFKAICARTAPFGSAAAPLFASPPSPAEVTDMEGAVRALHEALGGNGWAYTNYGNDELHSRRSELEAGVRAVVEALQLGKEG